MRRQLSSRQPAYRLHKATGQSVVMIDGKDRYLGRHGSPESYRKYADWIRHWQMNANQTAITTAAVPAAQLVFEPATRSLSVNEVLEKCWVEHFRDYYSRDGRLTTEGANLSLVIRNLSAFAGLVPVLEFGPKKLKAFRHHLISDLGLARTEVNKRIGRVKRIFKYAASEELVPATISMGLREVTGLAFGRGSARETEPVKMVPDLWVTLVLPFVSPHVATMIMVQRLTGMRPGELVIMRPCDIENNGTIWEYRPYTHKNRWRNHTRVVMLGGEVQRRLAPYMDRGANTFLFSPAEAEAERNRQRRANRRTPMTPSQQARTPKKKPKRPKRDRYDVASYRRAVEYGINRAKKFGIHIPSWFPNQLRHSHATDVRRVFGVEAAQVSLGQARTDVIEVYAEKNLDLAAQVAKKMG